MVTKEVINIQLANGTKLEIKLCHVQTSKNALQKKNLYFAFFFGR